MSVATIATITLSTSIKSVVNNNSNPNIDTVANETTSINFNNENNKAEQSFAQSEYAQRIESKAQIFKFINNAWLNAGANRSNYIGGGGGSAGLGLTSASSMVAPGVDSPNSKSTGGDLNNSNNSKNGPNGADIKLPASASIPNPSEITSKTDSLVPNPSNVPLTEMEFEVIRLTNAARQQKGLQPLEARDNLTKTARESSAKMQAISNMVHGLTSGWSRENIAMGQNSASEVVRAWLNSPGHYANIMSSSKYIGVGDTTSKGGTPYWTMQLS
ncbi:MAG: hypothetical protein RLZZ361_408 [Cyanobacteriota bacterium]|jgi:uncharacterized protein YkwD